MTQEMRNELVMLGIATIGIVFILAVTELVAHDNPIQAAGIPAHQPYAWQSTDAPEGKAVLGLWDDTGFPRSHVAVKVGRDWFSYGPENEAQKVLETTPPALWEDLP